MRVKLLAILLCTTLVACGGGEPEPEPDPAADRVSEFGRYEGYSDERFDSWVRTSEYMQTRDGTRLAVDVVRPAVGGNVTDEPLPVIWTHSRYHRTPAALAATLGGGRSGNGEAEPRPTISYVDASPTLQRLARHGYVFVGVGVRGSGASFGRYEGLFSPAETRDAYDVIDWIANQPWSDGNVGMWGGSYLGITQYMAASTGHPALKAIFPNVALFDFYEVAYPGGVFRDDMLEHWGLLTRNLDVNIPSPPVDDDPDAGLRDAAVAEHADNWEVVEEISAAAFRDHESESFAWSRHTPADVIEAINSSGVAAYHWGGWYDVFALDEALWWANSTGPQKLGMGGWSHTGQGEPAAAERAELEAVEHHRWFDYWLKGIDNGIMDEAPVNFTVMDEPDAWSWTSSSTWPPEDTEAVTLYFAAGPSGSVSSVNDGLLASEPVEPSAHDEYAVNPTTTTGTASRWDNAVGQGGMSHPDMQANDALSLTYTTEPLGADVTVIGHPVVTLWVTSSTGDADFHVLLEEVAADGSSRYITEGVLRASHRATSAAPWDNLGLPYQRSFAADPQPLPEQPTELLLDMIPTAQLFNAGNRIRVTVMGADADNTRPSPATEAPTIRVYRGPEHRSGIVLPVAR